MDMTRPDLSQAAREVVTYIEYLETELERLRQTARPVTARSRSRPLQEAVDDFEDLPELDEPPEPPTTINIITATASGLAKRTPRHLYTRQRRGGMGVFDLETAEDEPAAIIAVADESQNLLLITNLGRAFRAPVSSISEAPVRARGTSIIARLNLSDDEHLAMILADQAQGYLGLVSQNGMVRLLRHHVFGEYMKPGTALYDLKSFGPLAAACWTPGDGDLFIATRQGRAIRFSEKLVPPQGGLGIRLADGDVAVGLAPVYPDSGVFLLTADGKGTIRLMEGFSPNKAPGAGGKIAISTDHLVGVLNTDEAGDLFVISRLSKIIRFQANEVPAKDGVVQGVICMSLRADRVAAVSLSPLQSRF